MEALKNKTLFYVCFRKKAIIVPRAIIPVYGCANKEHGKILPVP
jgi:hypothetical protein